MMRNGRRRFRAGSWIPFAAFVLLCGMGIAGLAWANHRFAQSVGGGTDFLVHWVGMRAVLNGDNPYSDQTALEIQTLVYGRPAAAGEHELRVAYPLYGEFLFLPLAWISDFSWARAMWMTVLETGAAAFAVLCLVLSGAQWSRVQRIAFMVFSVLWYFGMRAIINGNAVILISLFFGVSLLCAEKNRNATAGFLLACCTIKPQVALLPGLAFLLWALHARRYRMIVAFGAAMAVFVGFSFAVLPTWLADNWREIVRFPSYNPPGTPAGALQEIAGAGGGWIGAFISVSAWIAVLYSGVRMFRGRAGGFLVPVGIAVLLAPLSAIPTDPGNEFLLLLPLAMILPGLTPERLSGRRFAGLLAVLFFGLWILFLATVRMEGQPIQHSIMLFPLPLFLAAVGLWDEWRSRRRELRTS
jgi:hypothetical protein